MMKLVQQLIAFGLFVVILLAGGCLPGQQNGGQGKQTITVYGFSIMKEALEKEIYPAFAAKWKAGKGRGNKFRFLVCRFRDGHEPNPPGVPADIAILSIERDATRLVAGQAVTSDWRLSPNHGIVNKTPFVILVRKGNPKQITDFPDLAKDGVRSHPSRSGQFRRCSVVDPGRLRLGTGKVAGRDRQPGREQGVGNAESRVEKCDLDTRFGPRGTDAVRDRLRRRSYHIRTGRIADEAGRCRRGYDHPEVDDLQRASGRCHRPQRYARRAARCRRLS